MLCGYASPHSVRIRGLGGRQAGLVMPFTDKGGRYRADKLGQGWEGTCQHPAPLASTRVAAAGMEGPKRGLGPSKIAPRPHRSKPWVALFPQAAARVAKQEEKAGQARCPPNLSQHPRPRPASAGTTVSHMGCNSGYTASWAISPLLGTVCAVLFLTMCQAT